MSNAKSLPLPCLEQMKFKLSPMKDFLCPAGYCFTPDPQAGEGYYWYYEKEGMFAVGIMDLRPKIDYIMEYQQEDFISVNYYDTISAEELSPYKRMSAGTLRGHVSNCGLFRARFHKNMPIKGTELILMPGYYHDYLESRYPGEYPDPKKAFMSIDGCKDFPELVLILKQIGRFTGTGISADMYFESKVAEALSLIIERTKRNIPDKNKKLLSKDDLQNLDDVRFYIEDHFAFSIKSEQLCKIACMGNTKLRALFKEVYGVTITEYIQQKRLAHAEFLLLKTDFNVDKVSLAVGYQNAGRFASLFKKNTGLFPDEYRKIMR